MSISEAARADLYTGLAEVLGPDRAETLMAQFPRFDPDEMATKTDVAAVKSDVKDLRLELTRSVGELREGLVAVNQRLDRLFLTLLVGMFGIVAALISIVFTFA